MGKISLPNYIDKIMKEMFAAKHDVFVVGGSVRDLLMNKKAKDWDLTTKARPEEVLKIFPDGKYDNDFGTVLLPVKYLDIDLAEEDETQVAEITTYRSEQGYSDHRRPDEVKFEDSLEKDLERRDFTINAMAIGLLAKSPGTVGKEYAVENLDVPSDWGLVDLFGGQKDLQKKVIRAVGEPVDRFKEDALRMMRAVRFASQLNFEIEPKTERGITKMSGSIKFIAKERIRDELIKILESSNPSDGIMLLYKLNLLNYIIPELLTGKGVKQNHHHTYSVWKHLMESLRHCPSKDWRVRLAALLHDLGKPKAKAMRDGTATFYNHEYISERMTKKIMKRLRFSGEDTKKVANLVRHHMFYYNTDEVTAASVRRLIKKVGKENLKDLIDLRIGDRLGSAVKKAKPYRLRHLEYMFDRVQNDPISVKNLKLDGDYMIAEMGFEPGPKMGAILDVLLSEVIEDPKLNTLKHLSKRAMELNKENVEELRQKAKEKIEEKREADDKQIKKKHYVK